MCQLLVEFESAEVQAVTALDNILLTFLKLLQAVGLCLRRVVEGDQLLKTVDKFVSFDDYRQELAQLLPTLQQLLAPDEQPCCVDVRNIIRMQHQVPVINSWKSNFVHEDATHRVYRFQEAVYEHIFVGI